MKIMNIVMVLVVLFGHLFGCAPVSEGRDLPMKEYTINLPDQALHFRIPEEIARTMSPSRVMREFSPLHSSSYIKSGFASVGSAYFEFNRGLLSGASGAIRFDFMVQRKSDKYGGDITTQAGLEQYINEWTDDTEHAGRLSIDKVQFNTMPAVRRSWNTFGNKTERRPEELEVFSLPLTETMFLDLAFIITDWAPSRSDAWKREAEAMREAIKSSVVLKRGL